MVKTIDNLCNSCTNSGCEFQSGIVRTKCAFYMPPHIDSVKQKLLDSLAEEPTMVLSTAYAYAKNYVNYGVDITKAWITAVQQASIVEKVSLDARAEAYDSFKKEYETRLKADMAAMLTEIQVGIGEHINPSNHTDSYEDGWSEGAEWCIDYIQEIISAWQPCKENKDGTNS